MLRAWLENLVWVETVNAAALAGRGQEVQALQAEVAGCLKSCCDFLGLAVPNPGQVEPMAAGALAARKREALALAEAVDEAMRPMGAPLFADLLGLRGALARSRRPCLPGNAGLYRLCGPLPAAGRAS